MSIWFYVGIMWIVIGAMTDNIGLIIGAMIFFMLAANDNN